MIRFKLARCGKISKDSTCRLTSGELSSMGTVTKFQSKLSTKRPLMEESMANLSHVAGDWIIHWKILRPKVSVSQGSIWKQMRKQRTKCFITQGNSSAIYRHEEGERTTKNRIFMVYVFYPEVNWVCYSCFSMPH